MRAKTERGGESLRCREGLVGSMHPEIRGAVAILWLSMDKGCWDLWGFKDIQCPG